MAEINGLEAILNTAYRGLDREACNPAWAESWWTSAIDTSTTTLTLEMFDEMIEKIRTDDRPSLSDWQVEQLRRIARRLFPETDDEQ